MNPTTTISNESVLPKVIFPDGFDYWISLPYWTPLEATLLLFGEVPEADFHGNELILTPEEMLSWYSPDSERVLRAIERAYENGKLTPQTMITWAEEHKIPIAKKLKDAATTRGLKFNGDILQPHVRKRNRRGEHFAETRFAVLGILLKTLTTDPQALIECQNKRGQVTAEDLATLIEDRRGSWDILKNGSPARDTIYKTITEAFAAAK